MGNGSADWNQSVREAETGGSRLFGKAQYVNEQVEKARDENLRSGVAVQRYWSRSMVGVSCKNRKRLLPSLTSFTIVIFQ